MNLELQYEPFLFVVVHADALEKGLLEMDLRDTEHRVYPGRQPAD